MNRQPTALITLLAFSFAQLGYSRLAAQTDGRKPLTVSTTVIEVGDKRPKYFPWEPHIAVDPSDPQRLLLGSIYRGVVGDRKEPYESRLLCWRSNDEGRTWQKATTPFAGPDKAASGLHSDPVLAFGPDGAAWFAGIEYEIIPPAPGRQRYFSIKACYSADAGKTWRSPLILAESRKDAKDHWTLDKPWLAVDTSNGPRRGTAYVAWSRVAFPSANGELLCASIPNGDRGFSSGTKIAPTARVLTKPPDVAHQVQLAVRHDGTVDAVWRALIPQSTLYHAFSTDGAKSFSQPIAIADENSGGPGGAPSLSAEPSGRLVLAWTNAKGLFASCYQESAWAKPVQVLVSDANVEFYNPTVAVAEDAAWLLSYRLEAKTGRVSVVLHRSSDGGPSWAEHCVIATRTLDPAKVRGFIPGHYVGLAAAKRRVYAAFVLPSEGGDGRPYSLHFSRIE